MSAISQKGYIYIIDHIPENTPYNRRPRLAMITEYITVHSTANPSSTARNERAWLTNPANERTASWHICVDEREAVEAIPLDEVAWHAGDGVNGPGNRKSIGIEICESGDRTKTLENAAELIAVLLQRLGLGTEKLRRHYDWSGKSCPRILMTNKWLEWENFKREVEKHLDDPENALGSTGPVNPTSPADPKSPTSLTNPTGNHDKALPRIQRRVEGTLDGRPVDFEAYLINNTTYVPLSSLAKVLGLSLIWQEGKYHLLTGTTKEKR